MQNAVSLPVAICIAISLTLRAEVQATCQNDIFKDDWAKIPGSVEFSCEWGIVHRLVGDRKRVCRGRLTTILFYYADPLGPVQISSVVEEQHVTFYGTKATSPWKAFATRQSKCLKRPR